MLGELLVGKDSGLFETVHAFADLDIDPSIGCGEFHEIVLFDDFVGDDTGVHAHVFVAAHDRCFEVEIF